MSNWSSRLRGAARQAAIELRIQFFSPMVFGWLWAPVLALVVMMFLRGKDVLDTDVTLAQLGIPAVLAVSLVSGGVLGVSGQLVVERDDGTLLRAKTIPGGVAGHLLGSVMIFMVTSIVPMALLLAGAAIAIPGVTPGDARGWALLAVFSLLALTSTLPWGALLGALMRTPMMLAWASLIIYGTVAISGVFYPLQALPTWLQWFGQLLPTYWVGLGLRSALLPAEAAALELGGTWHTGTAILVLAGWTVVGFLLAPGALSRMARRQSGSQVDAAAERLRTRGY